METTRRKPWFRAWDEMLTDPKMLSLSNARFGMWIKLLCFANQQTVRGIIPFEEGAFEKTFGKIFNTTQSISFNVLHASFPNWENKVQKRTYSYNNDVLKYIVTNTTQGGKYVVAEVVWKLMVFN